jgi:ABC-type transport system substrate-binding protein
MVPSPTAVKKHGDAYALNPVGVGPFKVESFKPGGDIVLKANPDYRVKGEPYLDEMVFVTATDTQARLAALQAGNLDIAMTQAASDFAKAEAAGLKVLRQPTYTYYNLLFNLQKAPLDDVRFRKAVIMAIDLEGLSKAVFEGLQPPARGILPNAHPMWKDTGWPTFNPEEAKKLVEEYTKETGNKAEFQMTTTSPPEFQRQAAVIQQMLADVGIKVNIDVGDQPTMVSQAHSGNYQVQHRYVGFNADFVRALELNHHSESAANAGRAGLPAIDALLAKGKKIGPEERPALAEELQAELTKWLPTAPLIEHTGAYIVGPKVGGFPGQSSGSTVFDARKVWIAQK